MINRDSPILLKLAELYEESTAGVTGRAARDFGIRFHELLELSDSTKGEFFAVAISHLRHAQSNRCIEIDAHRRSHDWQRIRVPLANEAALFALIGRTSPTEERAAWAALFDESRTWLATEKHGGTWQEFCDRRAQQACIGEGWKPFRRGQRNRARVQLRVTAGLLDWKEPALVRTVSARLAPSSKFIERCASTIESLLSESSGGTVKSLADLGIDYNPVSVRFHGPLRIASSQGGWIDYSSLAGESSLSETDLANAIALETTAPRCVTVENATKFHELCRLRNGDLFIFTSYPNYATVEFLRRLPPDLPLFHFGDTDPWGFDVLRALRQLSGRSIAPLHMRFRCKTDAPPLDDRERRKLSALLREPHLADVRTELERIITAGNKGDFEQESLFTPSSAFPYVGK